MAAKEKSKTLRVRCESCGTHFEMPYELVMATRDRTCNLCIFGNVKIAEASKRNKHIRWWLANQSLEWAIETGKMIWDV